MGIHRQHTACTGLTCQSTTHMEPFMESITPRSILLPLSITPSTTAPPSSTTLPPSSTTRYTLHTIIQPSSVASCRSVFTPTRSMLQRSLLQLLPQLLL